MTELLGLPYPALCDWLDTIGVGAAHGSVVFRALHRTRDDAPLAALGRHRATILDQSTRAQVEIVERHPAPNGVVRVVFGLGDGERVEGVILPNPARTDRATLCLSSQVGCAMGCRFCATGTLKLTRHLTAGEIVGQVRAVQGELAGDRTLTHLVFMGMGEPLHNFAGLTDALSVLFDHHGEPFDRRKVTVSTVGLVDRMGRLFEQFGGKLQLAVSLHAGTDATRRQIIPTSRNVTLADLKAAVLAYEASRNGRIMVEYVVLPGLNDTHDELVALSEWMKGLRGVVNLIPFNPFQGAPYTTPTDEQVCAARETLQGLGTAVTIRWPRGREASGACGQLMLAGVS